MVSWLLPALTVGVAIYVKGRTAKPKDEKTLQWLALTEAEMMAYPLAILASKIESGPELPTPRPGYHWKLVRMMIATSIFSTPTEAQFYILQNGLQIGQKSVGQLPGFFTGEDIAQVLVHPQAAPETVALAPWEWQGVQGVAPTSMTLGSTYITTQELAQQPRLDDLGFFLTTQELGASPYLADLAADPETARGALEALRKAIEEMMPLARQHGLVIRRVEPGNVMAGDIIVLKAG